MRDGVSDGNPQHHLKGGGRSNSVIGNFQSNFLKIFQFRTACLCPQIIDLSHPERGFGYEACMLHVSTAYADPWAAWKTRSNMPGEFNLLSKRIQCISLGSFHVMKAGFTFSSAKVARKNHREVILVAEK